MVRVLIAPSALKESNELDLLRQINSTNSKYKVFKYYLGENGELYLESCIFFFFFYSDCYVIYTVLDVIIKHLQDEYKSLMKLIWQ